jgi:hypothetical protein
MRNVFLALISLPCLCAPLPLVCQARLTHDPPSPFLESWQGEPDTPDFIDHKRVAKGAHLTCYSIRSSPKNGDDKHACSLSLMDGTKHMLCLNESIQVLKDDEASLECLGDKPTRCKVGIWFDRPTEQPQ